MDRRQKKVTIKLKLFLRFIFETAFQVSVFTDEADTSSRNDSKLMGHYTAIRQENIVFL